MKKQAHVPQQKRKLTIPPPLRAVRVGRQAPHMQTPGQEVDNSLPAGGNLAAPNQSGMPKARPAVRRAAAAAKRPAKPISAKFRAMSFGPGPSGNPFI